MKFVSALAILASLASLNDAFAPPGLRRASNVSTGRDLIEKEVPYCFSLSTITVILCSYTYKISMYTTACILEK